MLNKTHAKIIALFKKHHGYMSFEQLKKRDVTIRQMRRLEEEKILHRFARGWYWCSACGLEKPADYKYIEIAKINPDAVICLDSACYLNRLPVGEPEIIQVATARGDRKKMEIDFPIRRHYLTHLDIGKYIQVKKTEFGTYRYFSMERALYDCMHSLQKVDPKNLEAINAEYEKHRDRVEKYGHFLKKYKKSATQ